MRLLIADDDSATRRILRSYVSAWGHEVIECTNGIDALAALQEPARPAVAILDWMMPGLHGPTVCRRLREFDGHVYVILLTVRARPEDVVEAIAAGADEHLSKITEPLELRARLGAALRVAAMRDQIAEQNRDLRLRERLIKQSEAALQQAVANLRSLVSSSPLPIATFDEHGCVQMWNAAAERTFGFTEAEVLGRRNPVVPEARLEESTWFRMSVLRGDNITGVQVQRQTKDGRLLDISLSTAPLRGPDGVATGIVSIFQDISEEKAVERELLDAHAETERLFSAIASVLIGLTTDRRVTRWNSAAASTFKCTASDAFGRLLRECPIQWNADLLEQRIAHCQRLGARVDLNDFPYVIDGRERFLNIVLTPVTAGREAGGVVLLASDVTEYRQLQAQLGQAQRLESIGALAAGIAHEINTPMQYIGDNVGFLRDSWPVLRDAMTVAATAGDQHADRPYLLTEIPIAIDQTLDGVARVNVIVHAMKEFAHPGTGECTPIDLNHAITTAINVARHEWKYVCEIETDLSPDLPLVPCRPGELNQVILNLLVNAAQAIADAGPRDHAAGRIVIRTRQVDHAVEISVADTGTGIPESIRGRIFDPFFTTKEVGRGTGQGLAIVHDIVTHKHQGRIWFETQVGTGTTFHVRLPLQAMRSAHGDFEADTVRR
jgi:PAS domain S-box-containing protein